MILRKSCILFILTATFIFFPGCKKEKQPEKAPFAEIEWKINYYFYHSDSSWLDAPFSDWTLRFNNDNTFVLQLSDTLCTGKYVWSYTVVDHQLNLQFQIDSWNNPPANGSEINKIKEMMESVNSCDYYPNSHITLKSSKGTIDAQTL